jgi:hypothetical protein
VEPQAAARLLVKLHCTLEIEGETAALVAECSSCWSLA